MARGAKRAKPTKTAAEVFRPSEAFWCNHRDWLKEEGYQLRPRYQEGWAPSWADDYGGNSREDGQAWSRPGIMDATVIADGTVVLMKRVATHTEELDIAVWFSAEPQRSDPANHCVPILRVLRNDNEPGWAILVMPLLRAYDSPDFDTIGEAVEFFKQLFEGVQFMHKHNVAHRDCTSDNIMMDGAVLYRTSFHPIKQHLKHDFNGKARHMTRTQQPVKYYLTDFGLSRHYTAEERPPLELTVKGADKTAPEFAVHDACDPFPTDVYYLGNFIRREFLDGWRFNASRRLGFEFMRPLVTDMVQTDPSQRPDIDEVVRRFDEIVRGLSTWKLRSRVIKEKTRFRIHYSIPHWFRRIQFIFGRVPPIPVPSR